MIVVNSFKIFSRFINLLLNEGEGGREEEEDGLEKVWFYFSLFYLQQVERERERGKRVSIGTT